MTEFRIAENADVGGVGAANTCRAIRIECARLAFEPAGSEVEADGRRGRLAAGDTRDIRGDRRDLRNDRRDRRRDVRDLREDRNEPPK